MLRRLRRSWQKNRHELLGLLNGGVPRFVLMARPGELGTGVPVFCYHTVTTQEFAADLRFLAENGYRTLSADALLAHVRGERPASPRSTVLTFDDGAFNFYQVVFPLLQRFDMRAIAFIAAGMHFDALPANCSSRRPMTWKELRELHDSGRVDVESHTLESRYLPSWPRPVALDGVERALENTLRGAPLPIEEDLLRAKQTIEARLPGKVVRHLAFPAYDGTQEALAAARRCGYEACHWGILPRRPVNSPGGSPLHIARVSHEYLRRLPGENRAALSTLALTRARIIRTAWVR